MNKKIPVIIGIILLAGVGVFGAWRVLHSGSGQLLAYNPSAQLAAGGATDTNDPPPLATSTPTTTTVDTDHRLYQNSAFHFSLVYPAALTAEEDKEQGGAMTVTFENADYSQGFEVYITPYDKAQIDAARFKTDEPSGTYIQPQDVVIDGVRATMFFGNNFAMGDTREVWFIRNGYLYEVATYKQLDSWLGTIMATWKFI